MINPCVCASVCLSLCLSVHEHISGTSGPIFTKSVMQIPCGYGSVLLGRCCATLCTSGFMDDVTFGHSGPYGDTWRLKVLATIALGDTGAESDVYEWNSNGTVYLSTYSLPRHLQHFIIN